MRVFIIDLFLEPVTLLAITPDSGSSSGGTAITITGENFVSGAEVTIGGVEAEDVVVTSEAQITAKTPAGAVGAQDVTVTTADGQSALLRGGFTYSTTAVLGVGGVVTSADGTLAPDALEVVVINGATGTTQRTLTGGESGVGGYQVTFVDTETNRAATANDEIVVTVIREGEAIGTATYQLTIDEIANARALIDLTLRPIMLTVISSPSGPTTGGTTITITGENLLPGATVSIGGQEATDVTFVSATEIRVTTPTGLAGLADVVVTNPDGLSATLPDTFSYVPPPTVTTLSPSSGPAAGGTSITITGTNFAAGAAVTVGGRTVNRVAVVSATQITAATPVGTAARTDVVVTNPDGQAGQLPGGFTYILDTTLEVAVTNPQNGALHFPVNGEIQIDFGEALNLATVTANSISVQGARPYTGQARVENNLLIFRPDQTFGDEEPIRITVRRTVRDTAGNTLNQDFTFLFTTGFGVWPGDTNNDGRVNLLDVILIARYWNQPGGIPRQAPRSTPWAVQPVAPWPVKPATYADANGDGTINESDIIPIANNWRQTRPALPASAPSHDADVKEADELITLEIYQQMLDTLDRYVGANTEIGEGIRVLRTWLGREILTIRRQYIPYQTRSLPNFPNPFNPETWMPYQLAEDAPVRIHIYDLTGRRVRTLDLGHQSVGYHVKRDKAAYWDGRNDLGESLASGIYIYQFAAGDYTQTHRMVIVK